jgi:hypothetical protein
MLTEVMQHYGLARPPIGCAEQIQRSLPTGSSAMETAEHREPYESRGSRTDLAA